MPVDTERKVAPPVTRRTFVGAGLAGLGLAGAGMADSADALPVDEGLAMAAGARDELVELLSQLIRIRSHTGETAEEAQAVVAAYLSALPYRVERSADRPSDFTDHPEYMPPSPPGDGPFVNVVGRPTAGPGGSLALFAHIDSHVVTPGWDSDLYEPVIRDGRLYGLGSLGGNFYGPNEWVDVDDLVKLVAVLMITVSGWASLSAAGPGMPRIDGPPSR